MSRRTNWVPLANQLAGMVAGAYGIVVLVLGALIVAAALSGCGGMPKPPPEPRIVTVEVTVPGPLRSCVPAGVAEEPTYSDSDDALRQAAGAEDRYQLVIVGRQERKARAAVTEPILKGCR